MSFASPARAATYTVTNTSDSGPGSLRQAVTDANAAPGADAVAFAVTGTIPLTSGVLSVSGELTVDGPGVASLTVSGSGASGIFQVPSSGTLTIRRLTLAHGFSRFGGAIANGGGRLDVENVTFSGNTALDGTGGAIGAFGGTVGVVGSTFAGNSAFAGGAIEISQGTTLTISNSTFTGNTALPGGAISNAGGAVEITNSTFAGNSAVVGGALYNLTFATIDVTNSTFFGNTASGSQGAAIENAGLEITITNSLFDGNGCGGGPMVDGGGNLDWPDSNCPGLNGEPALAGLGDNGGATQTMALGAGSAAIDAALAGACPATDQRGVLRPQGQGCDIGAYESEAAGDSTPPSLAVPEDLVVDATGPGGAVVSFTVTAADDVDGAVSVRCVPPTGSLFPIGSTTVACAASDAAGNEASASFDVTVRSAAEQLERLSAAVQEFGPGASLARIAANAEAALAHGNVTNACGLLLAFGNEARAQSAESLTGAQADELVRAASRIRAVLGC